jgi:hypothetical protein
MPLTQMTGGDRFASTIELRTAADPANSIADLRHAVAQIDPNLPITRSRPSRSKSASS